MSFFIRRVYQGLIFQPDSVQIHPVIGLFILSIQFFILLMPKTWILMLFFLLSIIENIIFRNYKGMLSILRVIFPLIIVFGTITIIFAGPDQAGLIILRLMSGAIIFSLFFAITNPSDLARSLENIKIPSRWAMIPALTLMLVPRVAKDAEETFEALFMRGEIKGRFYHWLPKILAIFIASIIYRSELLAQSLYYKGFLLQSRIHYRNVVWKPKDATRLLIWFIILIIFLINI